jgi:hypothetical protein
MAIEIVSFPINSMVIFHSYGTVYQRVSYGFRWKKLRILTWKDLAILGRYNFWRSHLTVGYRNGHSFVGIIRDIGLI